MLSLSIPVILTLSTFAHGLLVNPTSPQCADVCGNSLTSTSGSEMTCNDLAYYSSLYGATFKQCIACELNSTYYDPTSKVSDLNYAIYNLRYALSWCLFGLDNNTALTDTPCLTLFSCGPLQGAFEYDNLNQSASPYSYCPSLNSVSVPKCSSCLQEMGNENYLANYVTILKAACLQQPAPGGSLSIAGTPFSSTMVNITTPSATPISSYNPSSGGLSLGAKIGIAVGGLLFLLIMSGCCIVWTGKRRRRRVLAEKARASGYEWQAGRHGTTPLETSQHSNNGGHAQFFDSPQSQKPLFTTNAWGQIVDESPVSGHPDSAISRGGGGGFEKAYFSPYSSTYTSPVSAVERRGEQGWPRDQKKAVVEPEDERGERIEMGAVMSGAGEYPLDRKHAVEDFGITPVQGGGGGAGWAPILSHPGYGRGRGGLGLGEEDARRGDAM